MMKSALTQYVIAALLAVAWGVWKNWMWTDYATSAIIIGFYLVLLGLYKYMRNDKRPGRQPASFVK